MEINMPKSCRILISALRQKGYEAYIVGGCVRDSVMGRTPHDWDINTSAKPDEMLNICKDVSVKFFTDGLKHGTISFVMPDGVYEITTFRADGKYTDGRRPDSVKFITSLEDDLSRRDFTMNAMAYSDETGLVDLFGGIKDIENGVVRCVGNPLDRFEEDGLRILRAIRFAARFGFYFDKETADAIHKSLPMLDCVSIERITSEIHQIIESKNADYFLYNFRDVFDRCMPGFKPVEIDGLPLGYDGKMAKICKASGFINSPLRETNETMQNIYQTLFIMDAYKDASLRDWKVVWEILKNGCYPENIDAASYITTGRCSAYEAVKTLGVPYRPSQLEINGNDLKRLGIAQGPQMGKILDDVLNAIQAGKVANKHDALVQYVAEYCIDADAR